MAVKTLAEPVASHEGHSLRVAIIADLLEEGWPSMDLVADMLASNLKHEFSDSADVELIRPEMRRRFSRPRALTFRYGIIADRLLNRFWDYRRLLRCKREPFDVFHVVDHSYAHLVHHLPAERSVVSFHDLDAFRCLLQPARGARSAVLRRFAKRTLSGLQKAQRVICGTAHSRAELLSEHLVDPGRLVIVPYGVHPSCRPDADPPADAEVEALLGGAPGQKLEILHVGSTVPRKRIDVLLQVIARLRQVYPEVRLIRVGGALSPQQADLAGALELDGNIEILPPLDRRTLAAVYRRAALLLQPSEREGFGLPIIEALASGLPVLASDLPIFREVGHDVIEYAPTADVPVWVDAVSQLLAEREQAPGDWQNRRRRGIVHAKQFSWAESARKTMAVYEEMTS